MRAVRGSGVLDSLSMRVIVALVGLVLVLVCVVIWKSEASMNADWGAQGVGIATNVHEPGPQEVFLGPLRGLG